MTWCPNCYQNSCPEAPDITINQTTIEFDGSNAYWHEERFDNDSGGLNNMTNGTTFDLTYTPVSAASITVYRNSRVQRNGVDYDVYGATQIQLTTAVDADDEILVRYFSASGTTTFDGVAVGTIVGYDISANGNSPPDGWLAMNDSSVAYSKTTYANLWAYLSVNSDLLDSSDATNFYLKEIDQTFVSGASLITLPAIIKY